MEQRRWWFITSVLGLVLTSWVISDVMTGDASDARRSGAASFAFPDSELQQVYEWTEKDLGLEGGDTLSGPARVMRIARASQARAEAQQQRMMRKLAEVEQWERDDLLMMGVDSARAYEIYPEQSP